MAATHNNALIVGLGKNGQAIANILARDPSHLGLERIFLSNRNKQTAFDLEQKLSRERLLGGPRLKTISVHDLKSVKEEVGVVILTLGHAGLADNRLSRVNHNAAILKDVAQHFEGYEGSVVVVTNPSDIMAGAFAHYANIDPKRVVGSNYVDTLRFRQVLQDEFTTSAVDGVVVGLHDEGRYIPVFSTAMVDGSPLLDQDFGTLCRVYRRLRGLTSENIVKYGGTQREVSQSIYGVVEAIINKTDSVVMSTHGRLSDFVDTQEVGEPVHIGYPVRFSNGKTVIQRLPLHVQEALRFSAEHEYALKQLKKLREVA